MNRRGFLQAMLAAGVAPAFVPYGSLMVPRGEIIVPTTLADEPFELGYEIVTHPHRNVIYVRAGARGIGDGSSWFDACRSLPEATRIAKAEAVIYVSEIHVEAGDLRLAPKDSTLIIEHGTVKGNVFRSGFNGKQCNIFNCMIDLT